MEKIIVAAVSENNVIGKDGKLPWHIPEDLKHFKELTTGHTVVMGRKTFESLPEPYKPLPNRQNIILTRSKELEREDIDIANSLEEAWEKTRGDKAFIIGGSSIYKQTLEKADKMVLTHIHKKYEGDTYFPEWDKENWTETERDDRENFSFTTYQKNPDT